jgi:flagellar biogenesis protein FliO
MDPDSLALYGSQSPSMLGLLFRLCLTLGLLGGGLWLLRWLRSRRPLGEVDERPMEVLSALSLGTRRQAVLLRVSGRVLLLGMGEGGIHLLGRFQGPEAEELIARSGRGPHPFHRRFFEATQRAETPPPSGGGAPA